MLSVFPDWYSGVAHFSALPSMRLSCDPQFQKVAEDSNGVYADENEVEFAFLNGTEIDGLGQNFANLETRESKCLGHVA